VELVNPADSRSVRYLISHFERQLIYTSVKAKVIVDGKISTHFDISIGVRQGDGLSATLFNLALHKALKNLEQSNTILNRLT
jgi:hypothetical protein